MWLMMVRPCLRPRSFQRNFLLLYQRGTEDKGRRGGGAGREIIDSNTSLPSIFTPRHF